VENPTRKENEFMQSLPPTLARSIRVGSVPVLQRLTYIVWILTALTLIAPVSAFAQVGTGHWEITVTPEGTTTIDGINMLYGSEGGYFPGWMYYGESHSVQSSGNYKIHCVYKNAAGEAAIPPADKKKLTLLIYAYAYFGCPYQSGTGSVNNGFGDPLIGETWSAQRSGKHLKTFNGASGVVDYSVPVSASVTAEASTPDREGDYGVFHGVSAVEDTRSIQVTSSRDPTYHREVIDGVPTRVANVANDDNIIVGDSRGNAPWNLFFGDPDEQEITFLSIYNGDDWAAGLSPGMFNTYKWTYSLGDLWLFNPPTEGHWTGAWTSGIPNLRLRYFANDTGMPGQEERVTLKAKAPDGAEAEAGYVMQFHKPYERVSTDSRVLYPRGTVVEFPDDWNYLVSIENRSDQLSTQPIQQKHIKKGILKWSLTSKGSLEFSFIKEVSGLLEVTTEYQDEWTVPFPSNVPPWTRRRFYHGLSREVVNGKASQWDYNGFVGDVPWSYDGTSGLYEVAANPAEDEHLDP
jgi:hypothetical protein